MNFSSERLAQLTHTRRNDSKERASANGVDLDSVANGTATDGDRAEQNRIGEGSSKLGE